jgi:hypothetical protein
MMRPPFKAGAHYAPVSADDCKIIDEPMKQTVTLVGAIHESPALKQVKILSHFSF